MLRNLYCLYLGPIRALHALHALRAAAAGAEALIVAPVPALTMTDLTEAVAVAPRLHRARRAAVAGGGWRWLNRRRVWLAPATGITSNLSENRPGNHKQLADYV